MKKNIVFILFFAALGFAKIESRSVSNFSSSSLISLLEGNNFICDQKKVDSEIELRGPTAYECIGRINSYKNKVHLYIPSQVLKNDQISKLSFFFHGFLSTNTFFKNKNNLNGAGDFAAMLEKSNAQKSVLVILESSGQCSDYEVFIQDPKKLLLVKGEIEKLLQVKFLELKLSGHSGAYRVVNTVIANEEISKTVQHVGLFDSIYDTKTNLLNIRNWLNASTENKLKISYVVGGQQSTQAQTEKFLSLVVKNKTQIEVEKLQSDQPNAHMTAIKNGGFSDFLKD